MVSKSFFALIAMVTGILGAPAAMAAPVTFEFTGYLNEDPIDSRLASRFSTGDIISGSYTFDSTASGVNGFYDLTGFSLMVGDYTATYDTSDYPGYIYVGNDIEYAPGLYWDHYGVSADLDGADVGGLEPYYASLSFLDYSATAFSSDALPLDASLLAPFGDGQFLLSFIDPFTDETFDVSGVITNVQTSVVPLPGALWLFISGLMVPLGSRFFPRKGSTPRR